MQANGPAVEGVNVTRRQHRVESWFFSQKFVTVQELNKVQMSVSGFSGHYESVLVAETKAKTVTSLLIIPSVLLAGFIFLLVFLFQI